MIQKPAIIPILFTSKVNNIVGDTIMAITIKKSHLEIIIDISDKIIEFKRAALSDKAYAAFETVYLPKLIEQIQTNEFRWERRDNNTATWLIDQVCHSRQITDGLKPKDGVPLADTSLGEQALNILRAMSKGQAHYDLWAYDTRFNDLFD